ncbi:hypothetical protein RQP46_004848 [Phenoliferia psychrophenolica]
MLGRRKKRTASSSSVDLLALSSAPPAAPVTEAAAAPSRGVYNFILDRARGAVGFGAGGRARTTSDDGSVGSATHLSSSPTGSVKSFFGGSGASSSSAGPAGRSGASQGSTNAHANAEGQGHGGAGGGGVPASSSQDVLLKAQSGGLFRRTPALSNPIRPGWLANKDLGLGRAGSPLTTSPSTPAGLSAAAGADQRRKGNADKSVVYQEGAKKPVLSRSSTDLGTLLAPTSTKNFSRSVEDVSRVSRLQGGEGVPPVPLLHRSSEERPRPSVDDSAPPAGTRTTILCEGYLQRKVDYAPLSSPRNGSPSFGGGSHSNSPSLPPALSPHLHATSAAARSPSPLRGAKSDIDLQKGWKPYRAVLKGSKLYLHKLPGDLTSTAKHLFPTTLLEKPASPGPSSARAYFEAGSGTPNGDDSGGKRKARAFWGTGSSSHPGLVLSTAKGKEREAVTGGTLEALVHELVFGTTFAAPKPPVVVEPSPESEVDVPPADEPPPHDPEETERLYDEFLTTLLLCAPAIAFPPSQLASELDRCTGLAVRTALEAAAKDPTESPTPAPAAISLAKRLDKIVRTICDRFPEDLRAPSGSTSVWKTAVDEVVSQLKTLGVEPDPDQTPLEELVEAACEEEPGCTSTPATEWAPTPGQSSIRRNPVSVSTSPTKTRKKVASTEPEASLFMSGTTFLAADPVAFAGQVHLFHLDRLGGISGESSSPRHILRAASVFLAADAGARASALTPLFAFTPAAPHFLSRIVLNTILPGSSSASSAHPSPALLFSPPPAPEVRVAVLSRWIAVGEELKRRGDTAGWAAVASAICCRSIARLEETWRMVDPELVGTVRREWALSLSRLGFADLEDASIQPLAFPPLHPGTGVPYLGSILEDAATALRFVRSQSEEHQAGVVSLSALYSIRDKLDAVEAVWDRKAPAPVDLRPEHELQLFFQMMSRTVVPARPHLSAYLPASLEVEPRPPAQHLSLHFKARSVTEPSPLIPLLMVEPLPHLTLVDREKIIHSAAGSLPRKHSGTNLNGAPAHPPPALQKGPPGRLARHNSYPPTVAPGGDRPGVFARLRNEIAHPSETLLRFSDGDIVFRIVSAALPTMPAASTSNERGVLSRTSSWVESRSSRASSRSLRASTSSAGRGLSPLSRNSSIQGMAPTPGTESPPLKLQVAGEAEPVDVVVKAGTVESLVDLLVLGIGNLRTPSTDADGESSLTGKRPLALDMEEYRSSFFATFRTFTSPLAVLDMLRKRYLAAPNASKEYVNLSSARPFPSWSMVPLSASEELDWKRIAAIRLAVLENVQHWVEHQLTDFLDDDDLYTSTATFLTFVESTERLALAERTDDADDADAVLELAKWLRVRFTRLSLRPIVQHRNVGKKDADKAGDPTLSYDDLPVTELVDRLDRIACGLTREVTEHDILRYLNVLESSTLADPAAWYSSRQLAKTDDDDVVIADPYSHLLALGAEPAPFRGMPYSLQYGLKVHATIRRWILCHLVDPDLTLQQRQVRMSKALEMIEVSRSRMSNVFFGGQVETLGSILEPSLASFVERATTSAVVSPESRLFASAWAGVAATRQAPAPDTLAALIRPSPILTDATATLDLAWLNERLVEIATQVDSLAEGISINFDKRRWIFNCVRNALAIRPSQPQVSRSDPLAQMERRLTGWGNWGFRVLRDVASGEGNKVTKSVRPFRRLVDQQQDKIRRDRQTRDHVSKGQKAEQLGRLQREKEVARAMDKSVSVRTRRMTAIFRAVRPISTMTPSSPVPVPSPSPAALQALHDWTPMTKPYLVLALSGVEVLPYDNLVRSFVFELGTEDGQRSLLQAATHEDQQMWITNFRRSGTQIAFRRATFLAQSPLAEEVEEAPKVAVQQVQQPPISTAVFGVPLHVLVAREGTALPAFVEKALEIVEERGLSEVGIYRISGENRLILETKERLNRGGEPATLLTFDVHNVSGLVKMFLRELPDPLIPFNFYDAFLEANSIDDYDERLYALRDLAWKLPAPNFLLLRRLTEHLDRVTDNEDVNAMHAANLSIIFAPTLLRAPPGPASFGLSMTNLGKAANIIKSLILRSAWIFGEETDNQVEETELPLEEEAEAEVLQDEALVGLGLDVPEPRTMAPEEPIEESDQTAEQSDASGSDRAVVDYHPAVDISETPDLATPSEPSSPAAELPAAKLPSPIAIPAPSLPANGENEEGDDEDAEDESSEADEPVTPPPPLPSSLEPLDLPSPISLTFPSS